MSLHTFGVIAFCILSPVVTYLGFLYFRTTWQATEEDR